MNFYPHNIGDFNAATRHLTVVERAFYRELIELYYATEKPLPASDLDGLARKVMAKTDEEKAIVKAILGEFFYLEDDVFRHSRCDAEILIYKEKIEKAHKAGKASALVRAKQQRNKRSTPVEQPFNKTPTHDYTTTRLHDKEVPPNSAASAQPDSPPKGGARAPDPVKDEIWKSGKALLVGEGKTTESAGSFLGKLCKDFGQVLVLDAVRDCVKATPAKPSEWLVARCQERRANAGNKQVGLEKRNRHAVSGWKPPELREPKHAAG